MPVARREALAWCILALALLLAWLRWMGPAMSDDSFQYLSEARHIGAGEGFQTSLLHFDQERAHGRVPAPLTTFPPGYALAVAGITRLGMPYEAAGVVVSICAGVACIPLLLWLAGGLGLSAAVTRGILCLAIFNCVALRYGTGIMTEALFTAVSLGSLAATIHGERLADEGRRGSTRMLAASGLLAGGAYCIRYAGLFLIGGLAVYHLLNLFVRKGQARRGRIWALGSTAAVVAPILARNILYTGSWKGGNTKIVTHPMGPAVRDMAVGVFHSAVGWRKAGWGVGEILLVVGLAVTAAAMAMAVRRRATGKWPAYGAGLLSLYAAVYVAGFFYLSMHSMIDIQPRTFYPLLPIASLLLGAAYQFAQWAAPGGLRRVLSAGAIIAIAGYAVVNAANLRLRPALPTQVVEERLVQEVEPGVTASGWIRAHIPQEATIVASCGQPLGYMLNRKTVSLVSRQYTDAVWDESGTRAIMGRLQAKWLILYPDCPCDDVPDWPYLQSLAAGRPADGFRIAAQARGIVIWEREQ